jgi:ribose-phosphate pyrophosphokinase
MKLSLISGSANPNLAKGVASSLGTRLGAFGRQSFPDDELHVEIKEDVREHEVFLIQPTSPPVSDHLLELLLLADACRRNGARRVTAVIPYFGYARQDQRAKEGEPLAAKLIADLLSTRIDRLITLDLHNPAIEGFFSFPVEHLSAVQVLARAVQPVLSQDSVLVAPDLGAVKLAERYADILALPVAYAQKVRLSGRKVEVRQLIGEIENRFPVLVDDIISTGNTMFSTIQQLLERGCEPHITVVASHGLFVEKALEKFSRLPIDKIIVTDSVLRTDTGGFIPLEVVSIKDMVAEAIERFRALT